MGIHAPGNGDEGYDLESFVLKDVPPEGITDILSGILGQDVMELDHPGDVEFPEQTPELTELVPAELLPVVYVMLGGRNRVGHALRN